MNVRAFWNGDWALKIVLGVLAISCLAGLVHVMSVIGLRVPLDPNEGWNAYHAAAISGGALYPGPHSLMTNNYPPLSFYVVGLFRRMFGDQIIAGRIVAFLSLGAVAFGIASATRMMGASRDAAIFASLLFVGYLLTFTDYVGMDDPQMLGHAIGITGFVVLLKEPRNLRGVAVGALLLTLAGFTKHNLIAQPLVLVAWLAIYDRRRAWQFAAFGVLFAAFGLAVFRLAHGVDLLSQIDSARSYSLGAALAAVWTWLLWGFVPLLGVAALFVTRRHDKHVVLCALYAFIAIGLGAMLGGGGGVDANALFDADIALAIGAGLALSNVPANWRGAFVFACVLPFAIGLALADDHEWFGADFWLHPMAEEAAITQRDIEFLRAHEGPALCEMLSLCYWAGKAPQVDVFNIGQAYIKHARSDDELVRLIETHAFKAMEFDSLSDFALTPRVRQTIERAYRIDHSDDDGVFLVPR